MRTSLKEISFDSINEFQTSAGLTKGGGGLIGGRPTREMTHFTTTQDSSIRLIRTAIFNTTKRIVPDAFHLTFKKRWPECEVLIILRA